MREGGTELPGLQEEGAMCHEALLCGLSADTGKDGGFEIESMYMEHADKHGIGAQVLLYSREIA